MLFNSLTFLLGFAPIAITVFFLLGRAGGQWATGWLEFASLCFYGWWYPPYVVILIISILFNYGMGLLIGTLDVPGSRRRKALLGVAISIDLLALCYYKYAGFFVHEIARASGVQWSLATVVLPLGISFFTFTQIAYLVDTYQGKVSESSFARYFLFVTYFPHLIAGPVIHHKEVMPQFAQAAAARFNATNFAVGVAIFIVGLCKKDFIADNLVTFVTPLFSGAEQAVAPGLIESWGGALAYTFQLYFDFSGYSDMAIGLSLMLNVRLPVNFNSPYKSRSIIDFWKRWHISLSAFLRDYLYIPLGGNRHGTVRRFVNLFLTMLIGGFWHGAGWTFIMWGALHGLYLVINHAWRYLRSLDWWPDILQAMPRLRSCLGWLTTFLAVVIAWVFFRAQSFSGAARILAGMLGMNGHGTWVMTGASGEAVSYLLAYGWCAVLLIVVAFAPNTQEIATRQIVPNDYLSVNHTADDASAWRGPSVAWAIALGLVAVVALIHVSQPTQFLYFNF